ncbi:RloB domain-containing protein [Flavobacterium rakeshii]|uniref:RloB domain-containing protein n=1 Tax=Flavobacterium rakeshii TaxID=1038845 RepID=A0A6N8H9P4_9FLAO|nr:RloB family protein [Flavobacterium rakeshii]MUV03284.1 RloB domain-containing protein [Flavobacterium rakeshii]
MKMKNKKQEQELKKKQHKAQLKQKKNKEAILDRTNDTRNEKLKILITCEGKNTEKDYFNQLRIASMQVEVIGIGDNTISLVKKTINIRDSKKIKYDEVWCVFDADPKPDNPKQLQNFNEAIWLAEKNNINVAYSHQAFEYWLLLHFNDYQGEPMDRKLYKQKLNEFLKPYNLKYDSSNDKRGKSISSEMFDILMAKVNGKRRVCHAIERAEKISKTFSDNNPAKNESSTKVFLLMKKLLGIDEENTCK